MRAARGSGTRASRRAAFTLIEVMVSLGVMMVGVMAILALQQHSIRTNAHSRQLTVAVQIAQRWIERLKQDAHVWNQVAPLAGAPTPAVVLQNTFYLQRIVDRPNVFQEMLINNQAPEVSNAFDYIGNEVARNSADTFYCAAFRPMWVYFGRALRVDVRVFWAQTRVAARDQTGVGLGTRNIVADWPNCAGDQNRLEPGPDQSNFYNTSVYHVVYLSNVIRVNLLNR